MFMGGHSVIAPTSLHLAAFELEFYSTKCTVFVLHSPHISAQHAQCSSARSSVLEVALDTYIYERGSTEHMS